MTRDEAISVAQSLGLDPNFYEAFADALLAADVEPIDPTDVEPKSGWWAALAIFWHTLVVHMRIARGRWYVWRDRPTWVVRFAANIPTTVGDANEELSRQAQEELALRQAKKAAA